MTSTSQIAQSINEHYIEALEEGTLTPCDNKAFAKDVIYQLLSQNVMIRNPLGLEDDIELVDASLTYACEHWSKFFPAGTPYDVQAAVLLELANEAEVFPHLGIDAALVPAWVQPLLRLIAVGHIDLLLALWVQDQAMKGLLSTLQALKTLETSKFNVEWLYALLMCFQQHDDAGIEMGLGAAKNLMETLGLLVNVARPIPAQALLQSDVASLQA